ncbi:MAG: ankyrin repeat-containing protein [Betaproteobacteria bacterium]|nr:ankyrin repeat-containing protein [Betaproteobacteria bacterium]
MKFIFLKLRAISAPLIRALIMCCALAAPAFAFAADLPDEITFGVRVEQGDVDTVGRWLAAGLNPNFESEHIGTGLMIAAWRGDMPMMTLFLKYGADVNFENRFHEQALMLAVFKGQREAAGWLVLNGARVNREGNEWSALHYATFGGHFEIARFLIENKADVNARSTNGSTVLMMAAREGYDKIAGLLIEHGAVRSAKNDWDEDALTWAMRNNHLTIAKMVTAEQEFAEAAAQPKEVWGAAPVTIVAPPEVETILLQERLAHAAGKPRILSDEEYAKVLERVAAMKSAAPGNRRASRMSITAKKGQPAKERAELEYGESRPKASSRVPPK